MFVEPLPLPPRPEAAALRLARRPGLVWLDGDSRFGDAGRWSFVASDPVRVVDAPVGAADPLALLARLDVPGPGRDGPDVPGAPAPGAVPCWIGSVSYDALACRAPAEAPLWFGRYAALLAFDHVGSRAFVVADDAPSARALRARLEDGAPAGALAAEPSALATPDPGRHLRAIEQALEHIRAGDIYQVNLARCWQAGLAGDPLALFVAMRRQSPVPLGFWQGQGARSLAARTMECFLRWEGPGGALVTRPIKGTLARAADADGDGRVAARLRADPKEQAEHTMIIDLMRNDLGRVARIGSVQVVDRMRVEPYAGLSHLVSTVRCLSQPDLDLRRLFEAAFPPGSVTGTPKLRAMQILEQLEPVARGPYTGAVGYVDRAGGASFAVAIRTAVIEDARVRYWAGGGIVADSQPERELAETELKARVFLDALAALQRNPELSNARISR